MSKKIRPGDELVLKIRGKDYKHFVIDGIDNAGSLLVMRFLTRHAFEVSNEELKLCLVEHIQSEDNKRLDELEEKEKFEQFMKGCQRHLPSGDRLWDDIWVKLSELPARFPKPDEKVVEALNSFRNSVGSPPGCQKCGHYLKTINTGIPGSGITYCPRCEK